MTQATASWPREDSPLASPHIVCAITNLSLSLMMFVSVLCCNRFLLTRLSDSTLEFGATDFILIITYFTVIALRKCTGI